VRAEELPGGAAHLRGDEAERRAARLVWQHVEPVHAVVYFAPEIAQGFVDAGVPGWWAGYFAGRAAPLGPCGPHLVQALFFGFAPGRVAKSLPWVWSVIAPKDAVRLRTERSATALRRLIGTGGSPDADAGGAGGALADPPGRLVELLRIAAGGAEVAGRSLYAANRALEWPSDPYEQVWHGCTLLREHRGDGHNAALVAAGLDGLTANVLAAGTGVLRGGEDQRVVRGWSESDWTAATDELVRRNWLDRTGRATPRGVAVRDRVEQLTDAAALGPVRALGPSGVGELVELLSPWVAAVVGSGTVGYPNPIGLTPPAG